MKKIKNQIYNKTMHQISMVVQFFLKKKEKKKKVRIKLRIR